MNQVTRQVELTPPERHVPIDLRAEIFDHKVGLSDEDAHDPALMSARRAFAQYEKNLQSWINREKTIFADEFEIRPKKQMMVAKLVKNELAKNGEVVTSGRNAAAGALDDIERDIQKAFRAKLPKDEAAEIRAHVKAMTKSERRKFLATADDEVLSAILSSKGFLSGLSDAEVSTLRHHAEQRLFPEHIERRQKLQAAVDLIDSGNQSYWRHAFGFIDEKRLDIYEKQKEAVRKAIQGED